MPHLRAILCQSCLNTLVFCTSSRASFGASLLSCLCVTSGSPGSNKDIDASEIHSNNARYKFMLFRPISNRVPGPSYELFRLLEPVISFLMLAAKVPGYSISTICSMVKAFT